MSNPVPSVPQSEETSLDEQIKRSDLELKQLEAISKKAELGRTRWEQFLQSPLGPVIVTAIAGFFVTQVTTAIQSWENMAVEQQRLKSSLILKVIETGNTNESAKNLLFLLNLKLIDDPSGSIKDLEKHPEQAPVLSTSLARPSSILLPTTVPGEFMNCTWNAQTATYTGCVKTKQPGQ